MSRWIPVAEVDALPPGQGKTVRAGGFVLALFRIGDEWFALDDACPHQGASLGEGLLHQGRVICPWHSWVFDVRHGTCHGVPGVRVGCYGTRVGENGMIEVELPDPRSDG